MIYSRRLVDLLEELHGYGITRKHRDVNMRVDKVQP